MTVRTAVPEHDKGVITDSNREKRLQAIALSMTRTTREVIEVEARRSGLLRAILIPLACIVLSGLFVGPAAAMRVMSDDELVAIEVEWVQGEWIAQGTCAGTPEAGQCCFCVAIQCHWVEFCHGQDDWNNYSTWRCDLTETSELGCSKNTVLRACCRWKDWSSYNQQTQTCVAPSDWLCWFRGRQTDRGHTLCDEGWSEDPCVT